MVTGFCEKTIVSGDGLVQSPDLERFFPSDRQVPCSDRVRVGIMYQPRKNGVMPQIALVLLFICQVALPLIIVALLILI
jgi:hypothetical protein